MGFCGRCGEPTTAQRCKCGGHSRDSATRVLFEGQPNDRWQQRYVSRSPKSTSPAPDALKNCSHALALNSPTLGTPSRTLVPPARPASPSKLVQSFLHQDDGAGELHSVFGSVLSPEDQWGCAACQAKFRQEETIYPHPDAKKDAKLAELFFCRQCFAERFRKGNCKKCKYAVLADTPFVKHGENLWHEDCYTCSYCSDPSTSPVIDFSGNPSCEACFDAEAYKTRGIPPSPHLSQSEFLKKPVSVLPAPTKYGRPSLMAGPPSTKNTVWSVKSTNSPGARGLGILDEPVVDSRKSKPTRLQLERDKLPIAPSLNELGERLRRAGLADSPRSASPTKSTAAAPALTSPTKTAHGPLPQTPARVPLPLSTLGSPWSSRPSSPIKASLPLSTRAVLAPTQPAVCPSPLRPLPSPVQRSAQLTRPSSPAKTASPAPVTTEAAADANDSETCPICMHPLGYGEFVELPKTGRIMHRECFRCGGCEQDLGAGKHVEAEGKWWHQQCAPAPKRYRTILTSLADPPSPSAEDSPSHDERPPLTSELSGPDPSCHGCGLALGYSKSVTVPRSGHSFHQRCFTCAACSGTFGEEKGARGFVESGGLPYHEKCAPPPASPSPQIRSSPFFAADAASLTTSRSTRLPSTPTYPPQHIPPSPSQAPVEPTIFARRPRPPAGLGGLLICAGCSVRATEKETVIGPKGRRFHAKCLVCRECKRALDSECRVADDGALRCEACRKTVNRSSYRTNTAGPPSPALAPPLSPVRRI
ncbi:uncharacterized protein JCM10292_003551 [Rhodotorula paludigena]|uniref:uncharacterized protein n=1 Tax=Rhodotorula paludigena TaxID=86838 RepID=UPI00316F0193